MPLKTTSLLAADADREITAKREKLTGINRAQLERELVRLAVPAPRDKVQREMDHLGALIGGPIERLVPEQAGCRAFHMPLARIIILGTGCDRPLLAEEARELAGTSAVSVVTVRLELTPALADALSFDFFDGAQGYLERLLVWQDPGLGGNWLVPAAGEGRSVSLSPFGPTVIARAPFYSLRQRDDGFARAGAAMRRIREQR